MKLQIFSWQRVLRQLNRRVHWDRVRRAQRRRPQHETLENRHLLSGSPSDIHWAGIEDNSPATLLSTEIVVTARTK